MKSTSSRITRRPTVSGVLVLLASRGPSAILGRVVAVVINAIDGVRLRRAPAHIGQEVLEGMQPAGANLNPAPAVIREADAFRVIAAGFHREPRRVFDRGAVALTLDDTILAVADVLCRFWVAVAPNSHVVAEAHPATMRGSAAPIYRAFSRYDSVCRSAVALPASVMNLAVALGFVGFVAAVKGAPVSLIHARIVPERYT